MTEASDYLIEYQDDLVVCAQPPQPFEESWLRHQAADIVGDRLNDNRGDPSPMESERRVNCIKVVEVANERGIDRCVEHASGARISPARELGCAQRISQDV